MKIEDMHIGMEVRHPQYGTGKVRALTEQSANIRFSDADREVSPGLSDLFPAEAQADLTGMQMPLRKLIADILTVALDKVDQSRSGEVIEQLGVKWKGGTLTLKPADPALQAKEVDLETFFHKIVMMRNNLRVLEQKINGMEALSSAEKFDFQQYITKCYGSMTTFNVLFRDKDDQFRTKE